MIPINKHSSIDFPRNPFDFLLNTERCIVPEKIREIVSRLEDTPFETFFSVKGPEILEGIEDGCTKTPPGRMWLNTLASRHNAHPEQEMSEASKIGSGLLLPPHRAPQAVMKFLLSKQ